MVSLLLRLLLLLLLMLIENKTMMMRMKQLMNLYLRTQRLAYAVWNQPDPCLYHWHPSSSIVPALQRWRVST